MKDLYKYENPLGGDGGQVKAALGVEEKALKIKAEVSYPLEKVIEPVTKVVDGMLDKLEQLIPGDWDKAIIESLKVEYKAKIVEAISE